MWSGFRTGKREIVNKSLKSFNESVYRSLMSFEEAAVRKTLLETGAKVTLLYSGRSLATLSLLQ